MADELQDARDEAELRERQRSACAPTASSRAFCLALGCFLRGDRTGAAHFLGRAAATLRTSFYEALEESDYQRERADKRSAALAAGALCPCGQPAEWIGGPGATGPCEDYPNCGFYPIEVRP